MRKALKFVHSLASCGMIGALLGYLILLSYGPQETASQYAHTRQVISALCTYMLVPSLGIVLVSGMLAMLAHKPYQQKRWVWAKAATAILLLEATLGLVQAKADYAADLALKVARGEAQAAELAASLGPEWNAVAAITALAIGNVLLGVWRPRLKAKPTTG
jgi:hypothetical protein